MQPSLARSGSGLIAIVVAGVAMNAVAATRETSSSVLEVLPSTEIVPISWQFPNAVAEVSLRAASTRPLRPLDVNEITGSRSFVKIADGGVSNSPKFLSDTFVAQPPSLVNAADHLRVALHNDAASFKTALAAVSWQPTIHYEDDEVVFEWISEDKHAVVSVEGDGLLGYTMLVEQRFISGEVLEAPVDTLPEDLRKYLA